MVYRGRAVPLVWRVLKHNSSSVAYEAYKDLLTKAAELLPSGSRVVFLADRGFADIDLMNARLDTISQTPMSICATAPF
jgi:hypothetical protein